MTATVPSRTLNSTVNIVLIQFIALKTAISQQFVISKSNIPPGVHLQRELCQKYLERYTEEGDVLRWSSEISGLQVWVKVEQGGLAAAQEAAYQTGLNTLAAMWGESMLQDGTETQNLCQVPFASDSWKPDFLFLPHWQGLSLSFSILTSWGFFFIWGTFIWKACLQSPDC